MVKRMKTKRIATVALTFLIAFTFTLCGTMALPSYAAADTVYSVDVGKGYQVFDGWGLSLSWWATEIGDWTRVGSSGKEKREEVMEAIYGESGLDLNLARYNVGGGDDPSHIHMTDDRNTPGWRNASVYMKENEDGEQVVDYYLPDQRYVFETSSGDTVPWYETPDHRQLWVLDWIQSNRTERDDLEHYLTEFYSNSPPYWMTISGCSSGAAGAGQNLVNDYEHNYAFVRYFLDVYEYLRAQGFMLTNLQPFNESGSYYWGLNGDQEGCYFSAEQKVEVLRLLREEMKARNYAERFPETVYNWGDETNTSVAKDQYTRGRAADSEIVDGASRVTYHVYSHQVETSDSHGVKHMYRYANQHKQEVYMSEICYTTGDEYDPDDTTTGFSYTGSIVDTVRYGGVGAYVFWQGMEDMLGQMKSGTNYGLIQGVYYTQEEAEDQGFDIAAMGLNYQDFVLSKAYYMSGQYTKYIKPDYQIVYVDQGRSVAAISPDGETLVIVRENSGNADNFHMNISGFEAESVERIITDSAHNWSKSKIACGKNGFDDSISAKSVVTYVVKGNRTAAKSQFMDDSMAQHVWSLGDIDKALDKSGDATQMYSTFGYSTHDYNVDWASGYMYGAMYTENEDYVAFRFYGVGYGLVAARKSDACRLRIWTDADPSGDTTATVDLWNGTTIGTVYTSPTLEKGWHTVYIQASKDGDNHKWLNFDGVFVYEDEGAASETQSLTVKDASGAYGKVALSYTAASGVTDIKPQYLPEGKTRWKDFDSFADASGVITAENVPFEFAALRLVGKKGDDTVVSNERTVTVFEPVTGVLYYADCGTGIQSELATGAVIGEYQSLSDRAYGIDAVTGRSWGYTNTLNSGKYFTGYNPDYEAMTSIMSTDHVQENYIEYKFELPAGDYWVAVGWYGGSSTWGTRTQKIELSGIATADSGTQTARALEYNMWAHRITATAGELTVKVSRLSGGNPIISNIVITDTNTAVPMYASVRSTFNTNTRDVATKLFNMGDDVTATLADDAPSVFMSDNGVVYLTAGTSGVHFSFETEDNQIPTRGFAVLSSDDFDGLSAYLPYRWYQAGAGELLYNIDVGFTANSTPPDDALELGAYQSTTKERALGSDRVTLADGTTKNTRWGRTGGEGTARWNSGENVWSIREMKEDTAYEMNGFDPNEPLVIEVGGHITNDGWGERTFAVSVNGTELGEITLPNSDARVAKKFVGATADSNGKIVVTFPKKQGDFPHISHIKVWSAEQPRESALTSDCTATDRNGTVTLRDLTAGATVYVLDQDGYTVGSFVPEYGATSAEVKVADYVTDGIYALQFAQAKIATEKGTGTTMSVPCLVNVPYVDFEKDEEWVRDGDAVVVRFTPHTALPITKLVLVTPDGVDIDLTGGFYYRAHRNGDYKLRLTSGGVTVEKEFTIDNIDKVDFGDAVSTVGWTSGKVAFTLEPRATSGIASVWGIMEGEEPYLLPHEDGIRGVTDENISFTVRIETNAGFTYEKEIVIDNIDKTVPSEAEVTFDIDFAAAGGVTLGYASDSVSGGTLSVVYNGGDSEDVVDGSAVYLARDGRYEFTYTSGTGEVLARQVVQVTFGSANAVLGAVTLSDGNVTVTGDAASSAKLYRAGEANALSAMKADKAGKYYLELSKGDTKEIVVLSVDSRAVGEIVDRTGNANSTESGSVGGMVAGIVIGALAAAAAVVLILLMMKRRKNA